MLYRHLIFEDFVKKELAPTVSEVFRRYLMLSGRPHPKRVGMFLAARDDAAHISPFLEKIGIFPPESEGDITVNHARIESIEKVNRLFIQFYFKKEISGYESRDLSIATHGGAVAAPNVFKGAKKNSRVFYGLGGKDEIGEESVLLVSLKIHHIIPPGEASKIISISGNQIFPDLREICSDLFKN